MRLQQLDLRNPMVIPIVSDHFRGSGFKVFARLLETAKNEVWAISAPGGGRAPSPTG